MMDDELLARLRTQMRIEDMVEDEHLEELYKRGRLAVINQLGYARPRFLAMTWRELPDDLFGVILMYAAHLYAQAESSTSTNVKVDDYCVSVINYYTQLTPDLG